jgi:hypothetical protein
MKRHEVKIEDLAGYSTEVVLASSSQEGKRLVVDITICRDQQAPMAVYRIYEKQKKPIVAYNLETAVEVYNQI